MPKLTIGQLAKRAGVSRSTLRYYEEQGLVRPSARSAAGYRLYAPEAAETLLFIQRAQRLGFSLGDIRQLLEGLARGALPDETAVALAERRYLQIERQLTELLVQRHEMGVFLRDLRARSGTPSAQSDDVYQRLVRRVCAHDHDHTQAHATLVWLLRTTGCSLASVRRDGLIRALKGKHIHVWRDGDGYRVLIPGQEPALEEALGAIAAVEAHCHAHPAPQLERGEEGFLFTAEGPQAFLFARFFLDLEASNFDAGS